MTPSEKPIDLQDLMEILQAQDYAVDESERPEAHEIISDTELSVLLDRSEAAFANDKDAGDCYKLVSTDFVASIIDEAQ